MLTITKKTLRSLIAIFFALSVVVYAQSAQALFQQSSAPVGGNPNGKVTLVEFFDYRCSHCMKMAPIVESLIKSNPDLRVIYVDYPVMGQESELAARAALAAGKQGKYSEFNQALMLSNQAVTETTILQTAKMLGLNVDRLDKDMASDDISQQLQSNFGMAQQFSIEGTPAFVIGKTNATDTKDMTIIYGQASRTELEGAIQNVAR